MNLRELPRADWATKLAGLDVAPLAEALPPDSRLIVVEDALGQVVGTWAVIRWVHVEGLWIEPSHRKHGRVGAYLLKGMREAAQAWGATSVITGCVDDEVRDLLEHRHAIAAPPQYILRIGGR